MTSIAGNNKTIRIFLAAAAVASLVWTGLSLYRALSATPDQVKTVSYYPERTISLDMARKDIEGFFQTGILLFAGLWSVVIVKKDDRLHLGDIPEIIMFTIASILLISFLFIDQEYGRLLERLFWDTQPFISKNKIFIDLFDSPYITLFYNALFRCFYAALVSTALTILSLCLLRGE
jgi:hypothetical protein